MFNSGILDVVIGLVVVYLQLSLVCTAIHELFASLLKKRAAELERGIITLLTNPQLVDKFYAHPLIKGLRPDGSKPSYIPSRTFALTVMDIVRRHSFDGTVKLATQAVADKTAAQTAAQAAFDAAKSALAAAQAVRQAAADVLAAGTGDKLAASKAVQDASNAQSAAEAAQVDAQNKLNLAIAAKTEAENYLAQVTTDANTAKDAETAAQAAEAAAKADPKNEAKKQAAQAARRTARDAADKVAPSAASLLTEARDKVVTVQDNVVPPQLKTALLALMDNAGTNLNKAQENLEQWFNDAMDRVSGVYKRKSQFWIVLIAAVVTIAANVDSLQVADSLSRDKALRESLVAAAPELVKADQDAVEREREQAKATPTPANSSTPPPTQATAAGGASPSPTATPAPTATPTASPTPSIRNIGESLEVIKKLGVPLGYIRVCTPSEEKRVEQGCPDRIEGALIDAETALERAQIDVDNSTAKLEQMGDATTLQQAKDAAAAKIKEAEAAKEQAKSGTKAQQAQADKDLVKANAALEKANDDLKKVDGDREAVKASQQLATAQLTEAKIARDQAVRAAAAAKQVQADAVSAEAKAKSLRAQAGASPEPPNKQDLLAQAEKAEEDAQEAKRKADEQKEMLRVECPKCRKESELSVSELKQRLPTTHGYSPFSIDGIFALVTDSWALAYSHWLGWLLTTLAISLGAPFWFDTLNRLMVIRSTIKPHEKSKEQESKDNPEEKEPDNKG